MKLALGTVQFGLPYGIANQDGQVRETDVKKILYKAKMAGMDTLDTAIDYGDSEKCLGNIGVDEWRVITKLPQVPEDHNNIQNWIEEQIEASLDRLGKDQISGLMLHHPMQLDSANGEIIWSIMQSLKDRNLVKKIGYSIYDPTELDILWGKFKPDIIQSPYNIVDQRLKTSGWLHRLYEAGVEIHVRSIFLQGLLLLDFDKRPDRFWQWDKLWRQWDNWLSDNQITALQACINFALSESKISHVIVGVDNIEQLSEILRAMDTKLYNYPTDLSVTDHDLINPSSWNLQ
jgi:aryl-alcohol dehydrogenase-like predicted oxidoreductase